ncbi:MAG: PEP-CTERM sorting domain-containing protein [Myxococcota bacterium]|nr:PEP-CTERM sorting domain-containing protein [Myxococcota bacterium]
MLRKTRLASLLLGVGLVPSTSGALPLVSEVLYDATGSDNGLSFLEIYGSPGTSLDGLVVEGVNGSNGAVGPVLVLSGAIASDGFFVVADDRGDGLSDVPGADLVLNFDFQNGPDSVVLRSADAVLDAVGYGSFDPDEVFAGEGSAAPDAPADRSLARRFANVDSDDNAADFVVEETPTPGSGPVVPEPATAALLFLGLAGLAGVRTGRA